MIEININDVVAVRLSERGLAIHRKEYEDIASLMSYIDSERRPYTPPELDANGWYRTQLWDLMETFGPHIRMGSPSPFEECKMRLDLDK